MPIAASGTGWPMSSSVSDYQYLLSSDAVSCPASYRRRDAAGLKLAFDERFRCCELRDASGILFGTLIGFAYDKQARRFMGSGRADLPIEICDVATFEREVIPRLAGAFLLVTHDRLPRRIYLDPGGSLPIVFSPEDRVAAASAALFMDDESYTARFDHGLYDAMIAHERVGGWISGTLTAHRGVHRLLPNHYLDLESWSAHRYWPRAEDFKNWKRFDDAVTVITDSIRNFTGAVSSEFRLAITLTAGFDSRLMLASARDVRTSCSFFTFTAPGSRIDVEVSKTLAERFGLRHRVIHVQEATESERAIWDRTVGDCMVEQNRLTHPTLRMVDADAIMTGMYGELGRCRLYRQDLDEINAAKINTRFVVSRLTIPSYRPQLANLDAWFDGVASLPNSVILDLAFLELKFGSWAMGQHPFQNSLKLHFFPFSQRDVLEAFMGVNPSEKGTERLFRACIEGLWPELTEVAVNSYGDYRDYLVVLGKLTNPTRVKRFFRDRLAKKVAS
jgi:hypothetical protein